MLKYKILLLIIMGFFLKCTDNNFGVDKMEKKLNKHDFQTLLTKNIYFGHKSVGNNIIEGINKLKLESSADSFFISNFNNIDQISENYFIHSSIGRNGDPKSKIDDFKINVAKLANKNLGIVLMKLCYADINRDSDVIDIFNYYVKAMDSLKLKYENLSIFHSTVPLLGRKSVLGKIKDFIIGKKNASLLDNFARNRFNNLLITKYSDEIVYDLAKIESTYLDGRREFDDFDGEQVFFLINEYTDDGGHLNEMGQTLAAKALIEKFINRD